MSDLQFSHCNIAMATNESTGRTIVWDRDTDTFGSGFDLPEALHDLAGNYAAKYRVALGDDIDGGDLERVREKFQNCRDE